MDNIYLKLLKSLQFNLSFTVLIFIYLDFVSILKSISQYIILIDCKNQYWANF